MNYRKSSIGPRGLNLLSSNFYYTKTRHFNVFSVDFNAVKPFYSNNTEWTSVIWGGGGWEQSSGTVKGNGKLFENAGKFNNRFIGAVL